MESRRVLLAVLLSLAVLIAWQTWFAPPPPQRPAPEAPAATAPTSDPAAAVPETEAAEDEEPEPADEGEPIAAAGEETVVVESDVYRAELSNRGARLVSFVLKDHRARDGGLVDLVRRRAEGEPLPFSLVDLAGEPLALDRELFAVEQSVSGRGTELVFRHRGAAGAAEKRFVFQPGGRFDVEIEVERPRRWALFVGPGLRNPTIEELENRYERRFVAWQRGGESDDLDANEEDAPVILPGRGLGWVALADQYFITALRPRDGVDEVVLTPQVMLEDEDGRSWSFHPVGGDVPEAEQDAPRELALQLQPSGDQMAIQAFWGAKNHQRLASLGWGLEETVNFGIFGFLARWLLVGLLWIYDNVVHNYGWAIVLMTVVIKILLLPLSHKAMVSAQKMREIQPQMQAVRAKWRGKLRDKNGRMNFEAQRKMNEEIRDLTQQAGVNPAGGCLPMLLQMPVLFAFYYLLIASVELRGADWTLWINDLSERDPYYVLPLVMGATQFLQMKMTPMSADPMQRRIMMLMPVVFTVFFLGFPAGLVLYWLTNNVLTIVQQMIYNRLEQRRGLPAEEVPAKGGRRKRSKQVTPK